MSQKIYVVKKYVLATSAADAIQKEKSTAVDDCWAEEETHKEFLKKKVKNTEVGFHFEPEHD